MIDPLDKRVGELCAMDYNGARIPTWDSPGLCRAFLHQEPSGLWVITEGTRPGKICDWEQDADAWAIRLDPSLDITHWGFAEDALSVFFRIMSECKGEELNFGGHSKGGSEAEDLAALWDLAGEKVGRVTALEPARVGTLGGRIATKPGITTHCRRNTFIYDPVPDFPGWLDHPRQVTNLVIDAGIDPFTYHLLETVNAAMAAA